MTDGDVKVDRVVAAVDPGLAISPDGLKAQIESGIIPSKVPRCSAKSPSRMAL